MRNCHVKNEVKRLSHFEIFYVKESSNLIGRENFGVKTQDHTSEILDVLKQLGASRNTYSYATNQHRNSIQP